jgi:hypothetical protein
MLCHSLAYRGIGARRSDGLTSRRAPCWTAVSVLRACRQVRRLHACWAADRLSYYASKFIACRVRKVTRRQRVQDVCCSRAMVTARRPQKLTYGCIREEPHRPQDSPDIRENIRSACHRVRAVSNVPHDWLASTGTRAVHARTRLRWRWVLGLRALATRELR